MKKTFKDKLSDEIVDAFLRIKIDKLGSVKAIIS